MEVVATAKWVRTTARKARVVTRAVEGLPVAEALALLAFTPRSAATDVAKVIKSAAANAEHNYNLDASSLRVARIEVEAAAIIKRFRPKPRGSVGSIFKRTTHLRAFVTDEEPAPQQRRRSIIAMPTTASAAAPARPASRRRRRGADTPQLETQAPAGDAEAETSVAATPEPTEPTAPKQRRRTKAAAVPTEAAEAPGEPEGTPVDAPDAEDETKGDAE